MMNQLTFGRGQEVIPAAGGAEWQRQERTHLENLWQDTVEPFKVIGDAWKNDRGQFTQETLRAINLAFNPVLKDEKGKYCFNSRALVYWGGLAVIGLGVLSACKMINNPDGGGITPGPKTPTPESLCPDLIRIAAVNSVDVAVAAAAWQAADQAQLRQDLACFVPESTSLTVGEILTVGQNAGSEIVQLAWARGGEVTPLLAVPGGQIDDLQLVNFLDPHTSQWEVLTPDQAQTQLAAVNINSASGEIEPEASGVTITATRDFNNNISFQINNPDGTQVTLSQDQVKNNLALVPWLTQVENLLKGQEMLSFEVVSGVDLSVATAEKFNLPQEVFALAREKHLAPIETEGSKFAASCTTDSCTVMLTDVLVNGAKLQPATDGKVIYGFDGQAGSEALFRFTGLPEGVRATAFVSQEGNPWGFKPGTVVVWFWEGGGKGGARILNSENPPQIMADKPNSINLTAIDNGLVITRTGPDGAVIDKQTVAFLPPLPEQFLSQIPVDKQYEIANGQVLVDGQAWFQFSNGDSGQEWQVADGYYKYLLDGYLLNGVYLTPETTWDKAHSTDDQVMRARGVFAIIPQLNEITEQQVVYNGSTFVLECQRMIFYDKVTGQVVRARFAFLIKDSSGKTVWEPYQFLPEPGNKYRVSYMEYMFNSFVPESEGWYAKIIYDNSSQALGLIEQMRNGEAVQWPEDILFPAYFYQKR